MPNRTQQLFYRKMGSGPAIVLLHGFPESGTLWAKVWETLSTNNTLIIPDLPGSGNSPLNGATDIDDMAAQVVDILDSEGIDKAVVAGHSMGGYVAFAMADLYPHRIAGLSLVHSTPLPDDEEKKKTRIKSIALIRKGGKNAFITQMVPNLFADQYKRNDPLGLKAQVDEALKMDEESMINFYEAMMQRPDRSHLLNNAKYPVQWIAGRADNVISFKKILEVCYRSGINFVSFYNNCGHMSMLEVPEKLADDLRIFIRYCGTRQDEHYD